jgi:hypothetical protein
MISLYGNVPTRVSDATQTVCVAGRFLAYLCLFQLIFYHIPLFNLPAEHYSSYEPNSLKIGDSLPHIQHHLLINSHPLIFYPYWTSTDTTSQQKSSIANLISANFYQRFTVTWRRSCVLAGPPVRCIEEIVCCLGGARYRLHHRGDGPTTSMQWAPQGSGPRQPGARAPAAATLRPEARGTGHRSPRPGARSDGCRLLGGAIGLGAAPCGHGWAGGGQQTRCARSGPTKQDTVVASGREFFVANFHVATFLFRCFCLRFQMLQRMCRTTIDFVDSFPFS